MSVRKKKGLEDLGNFEDSQPISPDDALYDAEQLEDEDFQDSIWDSTNPETGEYHTGLSDDF